MKKKQNSFYSVLLLAVLGLSLLISVNLCADKANHHFGLRLDLTENQLYRLSDVTVQILEELPEPLQIRVLSAESDFLQLVSEVLEEYVRNANGMLTLEYVDPNVNPTLVDNYLQRGMQVSHGSIVIEGEYFARVIALEDMFEMDASGNSIQSLRCEQELTSAIVYAAGNTSPTAAFTVGHNENASSGLTQLFRQSNYALSNVALSMTDISPNTDLLVIASPSSDFSREEIGKLDGFMARGGRMMVFLEPSSSDLINLKTFLAEWGIGVTDTVVAESLQYADNQPANVVPLYSAHTINQYFADNQIYLVLPSTRVLEAQFLSQGGVRTHKLLYSTDRAYNLADSSDAQGPYTLAMLAEKETTSGNARIFAVGSRGIYDDALLNDNSRSNAKFLSQVMNWCTETESALSIPAKPLSDAPIFVTGGQLIILSLLLVVVMPLGILLTGVNICHRRRRS